MSVIDKKQEDKLKSKRLAYSDDSLLETAQFVLQTEAQAILHLTDKIDETYLRVCKLLLECEGRVVVTGLGKSGHIAKKIAATLASTGTPAFFLHPAEALHGDLGMITPIDVLIALSNSGETEELITLLMWAKRINIPIIALTGKPKSPISTLATLNLDVGIPKEACPLGLAPTASTAATLAMGDALALSLLKARGFTAEDFARSHPGGKLGRRLLLRIEDIMHTGDDIPRVPQTATLATVLMEMTAKRLGFTTVVDEKDKNHLLGIFTDGDVRRAFERGLDIHHTSIADIMITHCKTVRASLLAAEAITIMEAPPKSYILPVLGETGKLVGALNMHDLFKAGVL